VIKCKNADAYQGMFAPKCNGGKPCDACVKKFQQGCDHAASHLESSYFSPVEITCNRCNRKFHASCSGNAISLLLDKIKDLDDRLDTAEIEIESLKEKIDE